MRKSRSYLLAAAASLAVAAQFSTLIVRSAPSEPAAPTAPATPATPATPAAPTTQPTSQPAAEPAASQPPVTQPATTLPAAVGGPGALAGLAAAALPAAALPAGASPVLPAAAPGAPGAPGAAGGTVVGPVVTLPPTTQGSAARATTGPSTQPADGDRPPAQIRLNFHDTPLDTILEHLSRDAGFSIVREAPVNANVTVISMQPLTPAEAVLLLNAALKGEGLTAIQEGKTLRIVARDKAKKGNLPVHFGAEPEAIEANEGLITQVIPVHNVDAVKLRQDLTPLIGTEADVAANAGANAIVMTDTSANVKRIVQIVSILDHREGTTSQIKIIPLKNANAAETAKLVLSIFHVEEPRPQQGQPPPPRQPEGRLLGTGVDQALHGGKVTAGFDERTNSVVVAAPAETLKVIEDMIKEIDQNPATAAAPGIKSFHLKVADAATVAQALHVLFRPGRSEGGTAPVQSHQQETEQPLRNRVTIVPEERTNTLIVTAPPTAMNIIEGLIKDVDSNTGPQSTVRQFTLKNADAAIAAKELTSIFVDPTTGMSRLRAGSREKISVTPDERTNTLLITAPVDAMDLVDQAVKKLDGDSAPESTVRTFPLRFADAAAAAKAVTAVFVDPTTGLSRLRQGSRAKVSATADERTNAILVTAPAEAMPLVEKAVKDLDAGPNGGTDVKFYHLKRGDADATAKLIVAFFKPADASATEKRPPDAVHYGVNAVADLRTNTVAVTAPPEAMEVVDKLVREVEEAPSTQFDIESFTLKNGDAVATAKMLGTLFQPELPGTAGPGAVPRPKDSPVKAKVVAAADERTNTVVVTAPPETLKVIEGVMKLLDASPASGAQIQVFQLQNADAQVAGKLLESIFQPPSLQTTVANATGPKPPGVIDAVRHLGWITTAADFRTNTLIVTASAEVMKGVAGIVRQIDANPASQETFFIYRLRNGQSQNLAIVLNQLFGNTQPGYGSYGTPGRAGVNGVGRNSQLAGYGASGLGQNAIGNRAGNFGAIGALGGVGSGLGTLGSAAGGTGIGARRGTVNGLGAAAVPPLSSATSRVVTELTGQVYVVADADTNSLLVTTATRYQQQVRAIIDELDHPVPQVLIKVLIAEVTHDNSSDLGTDFSILDLRKSGNGTSLVQNLGNAAANSASGGLAVSVVENNVTATLHALAMVDKLDVLSRPYILASDNQLASITIGNEVPFITDTRLTETGQTINTIQYQDVGIILNVTPHINPEGLVILDVAPEISQITAQTVPISAGVNAPVIAKRAAESRVGIKNGQTVVIGGLMEDRKTDSVSKVPFLGDIPLLGEVFKRTQTTKTKTELLIFLTPHVAPQPDALKPMSRDEMGGTQLMNKAVDPATFREQFRNLSRGAVPDTRPAPATQPVIEFAPPTTQPGGGDQSGPATTGPIPLP